MRKINFIYGLLAILFVSLAACKKDEVPTVKAKDLTLEMTDVTLSEGETKTVKITSGNGNYKALSLSRDVVSVEIKDNSVELNAKKSGESKVTVTDAKGKKATINVKVNSTLSVDKDNVKVYVGKTEEIIVSGSEGFTLSDNDSKIVTVTKLSNKITVTGKAIGTTKLKITDIKTKQEVEVTITVSEELVLSTYSIEVPRKGENTNIFIKSYNDDKKPYEYMEQYDLEVTEGQDIIELTKQHYEGIGHHIKVISKGKFGDAKFKIKDKNTNEEKEVTVTIIARELELFEGAASGSLFIEVGETKNIGFKGNGTYIIAHSQEGLITVRAVEEEGVEKENLIIKGVAEGKTTLTITDAKNKKATLEITIKPEQKKFAVNSIGALQTIEPSAVAAELVIPKDVKSIGDYFTIPNKNTVRTLKAEGLSTIGVNVFRSFENLEEVTLGENLTALGNYAFVFTYKLVKVTVKAVNPPSLGNIVFKGKEKSEMTLYVPAESVEAYKASKWNDYFGNIQEITN